MATESEIWFDRYVRDHGHDPGPHHPDLGIARKPDHKISWSAVEAVCEIKQFEKDPFNLLLNRVGVLDMRRGLRQVRKAVEDAAEQLKPLAESGDPLVVVLADPKQVAVAFSSHEILWALYGDPVWKIPISQQTGVPAGEAWHGMGRNGQLRNQHRYISAVVALRHRTLAQDWHDEHIQRVKAEENFDAKDPDSMQRTAERALRESSEAEERGDIPVGEYFFTDVFVAMSDDAAPLPRSVFDGPRDSRWEFDPAQGAYVKL